MMRFVMMLIVDQILHGAWAVLLRVYDHAGVTGWRPFLMMMVGMLGRIVVGVVVAQVGLIRGLVVLDVVRVARGARCGVVVALVVKATIRVHDHATDLV